MRNLGISKWCGVEEFDNKNIIDSNNLIAKFLGWEYHNEPFNNWYVNGVALGKDLEFHTSWDWLMPVWLKIHKMCSYKDKNGNIVNYNEITQTYCNIRVPRLDENRIYDSEVFDTHIMNIYISDYGKELDTNTELIEAVWQAIIRFIKLYNEHNERVISTV